MAVPAAELVVHGALEDRFIDEKRLWLSILKCHGQVMSVASQAILLLTGEHLSPSNRHNVMSTVTFSAQG